MIESLNSLLLVIFAMSVVTVHNHTEIGHVTYGKKMHLGAKFH